MQCLLIKTRDNKKFFTHEKNYNYLIEFSKTFNAEISVVKVKQGTSLLELWEIPKVLCKQTPETEQEENYRIIKVKMTGKKESRQSILQKASKINTYIKEKLVSGESISLQQLRQHFNRYKLSTATLCNHVARVKKELEKKGYKLIKIKAGEYKIEI